MTPPEDERIAPPVRDDAAIPEFLEPGLHPDGDQAELRSLRDDVEALIDDGKTYLEAELLFQRSRAAFVADRAKDAVLFAALGIALGGLALIGLTVGLIIALTPWLTAWGASAVVVALLMLGAALALGAAKRRWKRLMLAIEPEPRA